MLNWISTEHHPLVTLLQNGWGSAAFGMDTLLLLAGVLAVSAVGESSGSFQLPSQK